MNLRKNNGAALVVVILMLSLFTVLAAGSFQITYSHYKSQKNESSRQKAFYIAEACLEETRAKVLFSFQALLNEVDPGTAATKFRGFIISLPSIIETVTTNQNITVLGADRLTGIGSEGNNSYRFSYTATCGDMSQTLHTEYFFDDPSTFVRGDRAIDKVLIVWRK